MRKSPVLPQHSPGFRLNRSEERRAGMACRGVDPVAYANGALFVHARSLALPNLLDGSPAATSRQSQRAPADAISRRREEQIIPPPDRRADVEVEIPFRRDRV